ncbi:hypothetical protein D3C87_1343280 [compost metagenome]
MIGSSLSSINVFKIFLINVIQAIFFLVHTQNIVSLFNKKMDQRRRNVLPTLKFYCLVIYSDLLNGVPLLQFLLK